MYATIPAKSAAASGDHSIFIRNRGSGTEDSVHLATHFLVGDGFAVIEGGEALANLLPEPFVMVEVARNQLAHDFVRSFACLRGDPA
jgi:hypothetical protein